MKEIAKVEIQTDGRYCHDDCGFLEKNYGHCHLFSKDVGDEQGKYCHRCSQCSSQSNYINEVKNGTR